MSPALAFPLRLRNRCPWPGCALLAPSPGGRHGQAGPRCSQFHPGPHVAVGSQARLRVQLQGARSEMEQPGLELAPQGCQRDRQVSLPAPFLAPATPVTSSRHGHICPVPQCGTGGYKKASWNTVLGGPLLISRLCAGSGPCRAGSAGVPYLCSTHPAPPCAPSGHLGCPRLLLPWTGSWPDQCVPLLSKGCPRLCAPRPPATVTPATEH